MLNGSRLSARSLNAGVRRIPALIAGEAVLESDGVADFSRTKFGYGDAVTALISDISGGSLRLFDGVAIIKQEAELDTAVRRISYGSGAIEIGSSLYYTRTINWSGAAVTQIIAASDVGVVYGESSAIAILSTDLNATRLRAGFSDAIAGVFGDFSPSAIRVPATNSEPSAHEIYAALDSAHITGAGIRYIDGSGDAYAFIDVIDEGMRRQIVIGSAEMLLSASGSGRAIRNGMGAGVASAIAFGEFSAVRRSAGAGIVAVDSSMNGVVLVPFRGDAVIKIASSMTGYVYRRGAVLNAVSSMIADLAIVRNRLGRGGAILVGVIEFDGLRYVAGEGNAVVELNAESTATDYNFSGLDDEGEIYRRPPSQREFARKEIIREWRRA